MPIFEIPYAYRLKYVPARARKPRTVTVIDTFPVNVPEVSAKSVEDTGLHVCSYEHRNGAVAPDGNHYTGREIHCRYLRNDEGDLLSPWRGNHSTVFPFCEMEARHAEFFAASLDQLSRQSMQPIEPRFGNYAAVYAYTPGYGLSYHERTPPLHERELDVRELIASDKEIKRQTTAAYWNKALIVDEVIHGPTPGPAWRVSETGAVLVDNALFAKALGYWVLPISQADKAARLAMEFRREYALRDLPLPPSGHMISDGGMDPDIDTTWLNLQHATNLSCLALMNTPLYQVSADLFGAYDTLRQRLPISGRLTEDRIPDFDGPDDMLRELSGAIETIYEQSDARRGPNSLPIELFAKLSREKGFAEEPTHFVPTM